MISLVVPTYNVERYLPDFLRSLDAQGDVLAAVELVFVDDGSTDASPKLIEAWIARHRQVRCQVVTKPNGGLASARNAGLAAATGEWVSFPDPDDMLTPGYLAVLERFAASDRAGGVALIATNLEFWEEATGQRNDGHPLRGKFAGGHHRVVDLQRYPDRIHLSAASALYRRAELRGAGLEFDERIYPTFEDAHLTCRYLLAAERPRLALLEDARYLYRRRADASSAVQSGWTKEGKYLAVPRHGWLDLLRRCAETRGGVPPWVQNLVLCDLSFYFRAEMRPGSPTADLPREWRAEFLAVLEEVVGYLEPRTIAEFRITWLPSDARRALLLGLKRAVGERGEVCFDAFDPDAELARVRYPFLGQDPPQEEFADRDGVVEPRYAKTRPIAFYGRVMLRERIAWVPAGRTLTVRLDGQPVPVTIGRPALPRYSAGPGALRARLAPDPGDAERWWRRGWREHASAVRGFDPASARTDLADRATRWAAGHGIGPARYGGGWLLTDGVDTAGGEAEALYRYLRTARPEVRCWFVLGADSPDRARLQRDGFRLLAHGGRDHAVALRNCAHLVSSSPDEEVMRPFEVDRFGAGAWRLTYLAGRAVVAGDHRVFNRRSIDLLCLGTAAEYDTVVADGSPFVCTGKEARVTGLPSQGATAAARVHAAIRELSAPSAAG